MANRNDKLPQTVPGPYYVDSTCIDCGQCPATAPEFFRRDDDAGVSYTHRQPLTGEEFSLAEEARVGCPTDSIGNDGLLESEVRDLIKQAVT